MDVWSATSSGRADERSACPRNTHLPSTSPSLLPRPRQISRRQTNILSKQLDRIRYHTFSRLTQGLSSPRNSPTAAPGTLLPWCAGLPGFHCSLRKRLIACVQSVTLHTTHGDLKIEVFCEAVPKAAENFLALCASGSYDGCLWHRCVPACSAMPAGRLTEGLALFSIPSGTSRRSWCRPATQPGPARAASRYGTGRSRMRFGRR